MIAMLLLLVMCLLASIMGVLGAMWLQKKKIEFQKKDLDWYIRTYPVMQGWQTGIGHYLFCSLDGGKHWYEAVRCEPVEYEHGGYRIIGQADPQKLVQVRDMQRFLDHVAAHGSIDMTQAGDSGLLRDAGFTVVNKPPAD